MMLNMPNVLNESVDVKSGTIKSLYYTISTKTLGIKFASNSIYEYYDVPIDVYLSLKYAESVGSFFCKNIRDYYAYKLIE